MPSDGRDQRCARPLALLALGLLLALVVLGSINQRSGTTIGLTAVPPSTGTATPAPTPTPTRTATAPPPPTQPPVPSDTPAAAGPVGPLVVIIARDPIAEYVDLRNDGSEVVSLDGWHLVSERGNQVCWLSGPLYPGERLRVWADGGYEVGLHCRFRRNIWSNTEPDAAVLYNAQGEVVDRLE